jgi:ribosome biogenesis GTPase A
MNNNELNKFRQEMSELQKELQSGLQDMLHEVGHRLNKSEKEAIENEVAEIHELIDRLKTGLIWIALFGKTTVGKSAIANSLIGEDLAETGVEHDLTTKPEPYVKEPWMIVDVPGIMGEEVNEKIALDEAGKAHGHIFVVDSEPLGPEIALFDLVYSKMPNSPRVVFVNKQDVLFHGKTNRDKEVVTAMIKKKMKKYVKHENDIVFGSAMLLDIEKDAYVRQRLEQLEDRLYEDAGTLGQIMNVLDPANRAAQLNADIQKKILEIRKKVARKVIHGFAMGAIASSFVPFDSLLVAPAMYASLTYAIVKIMGGTEPPDFNRGRMASDILKVCGQILAADFVAVTILETITNFFGPIGILVDVAGLSYFKYQRTLIFGEATIIYIENGFTFGGNAAASINRAKAEAKKHYNKFMGDDK